MTDQTDSGADDSIAVVGIACRFPAAPDKERFWKNLCEGVDGVRDIDSEYLRALGVPKSLIDDPSYIWSTGHLDGVDAFDAAFFGYSPREAALMDPQHRLFLECCWAALEDTGLPPRHTEGTVSVFGGCAMNKYLINNVLADDVADRLEGWDGGIPPGSSPDAMPARVAYQLGLTGASVAVQTACSSALSAVCLAADALCSYACDTALAGGVSVELPELPGYRYHQGGLVSEDGRCRPYDVAASGSVFGSGVGVVVLKRLSDAIEAGDDVYAVLRGWAINNDGNKRAGYSAPGVDGQTAVIAEAMRMAGVGPNDLQYVEGHGSGTPVGDRIEVRALLKAFDLLGTSPQCDCVLGSVKGNIGHTDAAAGAAGLIKTILAVRDGTIPGTLHFTQPHEELSINGTPLRITGLTTPWPSVPIRRAGVSSFGMGGANAHVIVEQAPLPTPEYQPPHTEPTLLVWSAADEKALLRSCQQHADALMHCADDLRDVAFTLATGREPMPARAALVARAPSPAAGALASGDGVITATAPRATRPVAFMFPGVGDAYGGVADDLYGSAPAFRDAVDECVEILRPLLDDDIRDHLFPSRLNTAGEPDPRSVAPGADERLAAMLAAAGGASQTGRTIFDQPATFVLEYALARLFLAWGARPAAMIGHSVGEYVAACLSGVISLEDALRVVVVRATAIGSLAKGGMLAVPLPEHELLPLLGDDLWIGAVNTPNLTVLSGLDDALDRMERNLMDRGVVSRRVRAEHPFHSELVAPICPAVAEVLENVHLQEPTTPYIAGVTGDWITAEQASSPEYWATHICHPVRFADGITTLANKDPEWFYLELGPGQSLSSFTVATLAGDQTGVQRRVAAAVQPAAHAAAAASTLEAFGRMWTAGCDVDPAAPIPRGARRRVHLPTYPFERRRHWIARELSARENNRSSVQPRPNPPVSGGVSRADALALPQPVSTTHQLEQAGGETSATETILVKAFGELLGHTEIFVGDDFFQLGGHSLLALQIVNKLWSEHGIELHVDTILESRTISAIAKAMVLPDAPNAEMGSVPTLSVAPKPSAQSRGGQARQSTHDLVLESLTRSLGWQPRDVDPLRHDELATALGPLVHATQRATGVRFYPHEIEGLATVSDITAYLDRELERWADSAAQMETHRELCHEGHVSAAFVLSSPRAGSTLLRVMLAGHPDLFCPPELHLLATRDMRERRVAEPGPDRNQGIARAMMELTGCTADQAAERVADYEARNVTTAELFRDLANLARPRLLVDKSPGNARYAETLDAVADFVPAGRYIHLVRHPVPVIESMVRNRFSALMNAGDMDPFEFAEHIWARYNTVVTEFLGGVDPERRIVIRYEELVTEPERVMKDVCQALGVGFDERVLHPYEGRRMRDGLGDPDFVRHHRIDSDLAGKWRETALPRQLTRTTRQLARELGYDMP